MTRMQPGAYAALPTFLDADEALDLTAIREHVARLADAGLDGILACGSTGEFVALDEDERIAVAEAALEAGAGRLSVGVQVGSSSTRQSVRLARHAAAAGADAIACVTPYYLKTDEATCAPSTRPRQSCRCWRTRSRA